jgi:hypothetical protein
MRLGQRCAFPQQAPSKIRSTVDTVVGPGMQANGTHRLVGEAAGHREDRQADIQQSCVRTRQWSLQPRMDHMFRQ